MCSWANFYQGLAKEAAARAARAANPSLRDKFEAVAKEWATLAVWAELGELAFLCHLASAALRATARENYR